MIWGAVIAAGASLIGQLVAQGDHEKAQELRDQLLNVVSRAGYSIPQFDAMIAAQAKSAPNVQADPQVRAAQMGALNQLQNLANHGGMDAQAQAQMLQARDQSDQYLRGNTQAVLNDRAARGIGGSGDELAAILGGAQGASQQNALAGANAASAARQRALEALAQSGTLSGNIRGQDFQLDNSNRDAANEMARFNAGLRQQAMMSDRDYQLALAQLRMQSARDYANVGNGVAAGEDNLGNMMGRDFAAGGKLGNQIYSAYQQGNGGDAQTADPNAGSDYTSGLQNQGTIGGGVGEQGGNLMQKKNNGYTSW